MCVCVYSTESAIHSLPFQSATTTATAQPHRPPKRIIIFWFIVILLWAFAAYANAHCSFVSPPPHRKAAYILYVSKSTQWWRAVRLSGDDGINLLCKRFLSVSDFVRRRHKFANIACIRTITRYERRIQFFFFLFFWSLLPSFRVLSFTCTSSSTVRMCQTKDPAIGILSGICLYRIYL